MAEKKTFPGVGHYVDAAVRAEPDPAQARGAVADDSLLNEIGNLIGQAIAYGPIPEGQQILAVAEVYARSLFHRAEVAEAMLADAWSYLHPAAPAAESVTPPATGA